MATANNYNRTFESSFGGFGVDDKMCIDQRGFKHFLHAEASEFLLPHQLSLSSTVSTINTTSSTSISVTLADGRTLTAKHALVTFSTGVLQHDDVLFVPKLPSWKVEAVESMKMATYTKIFLVFERKFWHDTEVRIMQAFPSVSFMISPANILILLPVLQMGLYAHPHRRT